MTILDYDLQAIAAMVIAPFVGSFLATVVVRLPAGESVVTGRSRCPHCGQALSVLDLMPALSWVFLRGRCRQCGTALGKRYLVVELAALLVAVWGASIVDDWLIWPSCLLGWSLLTLAAIDMENLVLPDVLTLPLIVAGLAVAWLLNPATVWHHFLGMAAMYLAFWTVSLGYRALRGREGLGRGDAKLAAAAGAWTSWIGAPGVVLLACGAAFIFVLWRTVRGRPLGARERFAFGPYLCVGLWLTWLYGPVEFGPI